MEGERQRAWCEYHEDLNQRLGFHTGLNKAERSLAVQMRTGKIGLAAFLYARKVPSVENASCTCGLVVEDTGCQSYAFVLPRE